MQTVITGCGWVTPRAAGEISTVLQAYAGRNGDSPPSSRYEPIGSEIFSQFTNLPGEAAKEDAVRLAAVALEIAWKQAGLTAESYASDRKGLVLGCALAGVSGMIDFANDVRTQSARFVSPIRFPQTVGNYICGALARGYDFRGPASTIACGSASSLECIREGCALLSSGLADVVIAGGTELLSPGLVEGLNEPDVRFADGACLFVLEHEDSAQKRGANILATIPVGGPPVSHPKPLGDELISAAGFFQSRAISMEQWTGRTLGSDGAAALAAAIGSTMRQVVPCFGIKPSDEIAEAYYAVAGNEPLRRNILIRASDTANRIRELQVIVQ